jgi:hypothetical protein
MNDNPFESIERAARSGGPAEAFEFLSQRFRAEKQLPQLFEVRLMKRRHELGLPLIQTAPLNDLPDETRRQYEEAYLTAAREVGGLYLESGDIPHAWPYFRAIGEPAPVAAAIEKVEPGAGIEPIIEIAYHERANPRKGFELILANYGTCSAITSFEQYPGREGREECIRTLVQKLHGDLVESLRYAITQHESTPPESMHIPELVANRDWLFEDNNYHVDTSHLAAVVRFSIDVADHATLRQAVELTEYGRRLSSLFRYRGNPPFEDHYVDYGMYLKTLLGEDVDRGIDHFRQKLNDTEANETNALAAQAVVNLLTRLDRFNDAIDVSLKYLQGVDPGYLSCPTTVQLCAMAGDGQRLKDVARQQEDLLSFTAALLRGAT